MHPGTNTSDSRLPSMRGGTVSHYPRVRHGRAVSKPDPDIASFIYRAWGGIDARVSRKGVLAEFALCSAYEPLHTADLRRCPDEPDYRAHRRSPQWGTS